MSNWYEAYERTIKSSIEQNDTYSLHPMLEIILSSRPSIRSIDNLNQKEDRLRAQIWWALYGYLGYKGISRLLLLDLENAFIAKETPFGNLALPYNEFIHQNLVLFPEIAKRFDLTLKEGFEDFLRYYYSIYSLDLKLFEIFPLDLRLFLTSVDVANGSGLPRYFNEYLRFRFKSDFDEHSEEILKDVHLQITSNTYQDEEYAVLANSLSVSNVDCEPLPEDRFPLEGVNLIGALYGELGIGEDVRLMGLVLEKSGIPFSAFEFPKGAGGRNNDFMLKKKSSDYNSYDINLFCLPPYEGYLSLLQLPHSFFKGRYNILYAPWELPRWPKIHDALFEIFDEVWTATGFVLNGCPKGAHNVFKMPLPVSLTHLRLENKMKRDHFNLSSGFFYFLFMFDSNSKMERKNPLACLRAFRQAFPLGTENVGLVVKAMNLNELAQETQELFLHVKKDSRIKIISSTLDRENVIDLINSCDAFISLHRSEGFGRGLAEAMLLKKPVVTTAFSGNMEFTNKDNSYLVDYKLIDVKTGDYFFPDGQKWADVDIASAAQQMRLCLVDEDLRRHKVGQGFLQISKFHSIEKVAQELKVKMDGIRSKISSRN